MSGFFLAPAIPRPRGTAALSAQVATSTATGGNARGANAVDWQTLRAVASQVASGASAVIGGGQNNTAGGAAATVGGGDTNSATALGATVAGGRGNAANVQDSWVPGGGSAHTRTVVGRGAWGSGQFSTAGDAQAGEHVLRKQSTSATIVRLTSDATAASAFNSVNLPNSGTYLARMMVVARQTSGSSGTAGDSAGWSFDVLVTRGANAAATAIVGGIAQTSAPGAAAITAGAAFAPSLNIAAAAAWRVTVDADTTNGGIAVSGTGEANKNINWVARVLSVEVVG